MSNLVTEKIEFDRVWPWLNESMCRTCPLYTKDHIWDCIVRGEAFLWTGEKCAIVGCIILHPIGFSSFNYWLQGGNLEELLTLQPGIEKWAIDSGCARAMGEGRPGWAKAMDGDWVRGPTWRYKWLTEPPAAVKL